MRAMLGKAAEKVGRVATILHCIHAAHFGAEVSQKIPASRVKAAIKWVEYTTQQALSINVEVCSPNALESNLAKIISLAERNGGSVTVRDILRTFDSQFRPTPQTVQEWLASLESMKYGEVTQKGRSIRFSLCESSAFSAFAENPGGIYVSNAEDSLRTTSAFSAFDNQRYKISELNAEERGGNAEETSAFINPYADKDVGSKIKNAENAEDFTKIAETSQPSMLSCTTESAEFTDEHRAKMLADKMREAIASSNFEVAKEIVLKKVNVSTSQFRGLFWQNLERTKEKNKARLLAFANLSEGTRLKYVGKIEQYVQEELTAYDADGHGGITCLLANGRSFTTWIPTRDLRKKL
jgi:hypothetical protein